MFILVVMQEVIEKYLPYKQVIPFITDYCYTCRADGFNHIRGESIEEIESSCSYDGRVQVEFILEGKISMFGTVKIRGEFIDPMNINWHCRIPLKYRDEYRGKMVFSYNTGSAYFRDLFNYFKEKNIEKLITKI